MNIRSTSEMWVIGGIGVESDMAEDETVCGINLLDYLACCIENIDPPDALEL